jgi:DNA-binding XRE family transcriptional regulator
MQFYQRLRDVREDAEKRQPEIAALLGISQQHCTFWNKD